MLTQRYIERPVDEHVLPRIWRNEPLFHAISVSLALMLLGYWTSTRSARYVERSVHQTFADARNDRMHHECWARSVQVSTRQSCGFGDVGSGTTLALLGDLHAEHWLGGLERAGREHGWRIQANVMGGCPVVLAIARRCLRGSSPSDRAR